MPFQTSRAVKPTDPTLHLGYAMYGVSTRLAYGDPKIVEIEMGLLSFDEKLALMPLSPLPAFPYS